MEPLAMVSAALSATKNLRDLLKRGQPSAEINSAIAELLTALADAQQREGEMLNEIRSLEGELSTLRNWNTIMADYRLESVGEGVLAYVHQPSKGDPTMAHWLCQCCADAGRKVVLQCISRAMSSTFRCPQCKFTITAGKEAAKMLGAEPYAVGVVQPMRRRRHDPLL